MVSDDNYINLYMVKYNVMYICELTHYTLTWLNPYEFDASNVTTNVRKLKDYKCMNMIPLDCM